MVEADEPQDEAGGDHLQGRETAPGSNQACAAAGGSRQGQEQAAAEVDKEQLETQHQVKDYSHETAGSVAQVYMGGRQQWDGPAAYKGAQIEGVG